MNKIFLLLFVGFTCLFSACGGDDAPTPTPDVSKKQLISKAWRFISQKENGVETYINVPTCKADDLTIINQDGTFQMTNGATKCSPNDDQIIASATWVFLDNETKFRFLLDDAPIFTILELSATKLKLSATLDNDLVEWTYVPN